MSASREKKQRQSAGPGQKAVKARQEQAARKRQAVIYSAVGGVAAVLVIALLVWRSGFFQARTGAADVGGETLTAAELSYYYYRARQTTAMYASYGLNSYDTGKPDDEQFYSEADSQTYRDYFMETALNTAREHLALSRQAAGGGHTEAEVREDLDAQIASAKASAASYGMGYGAYLKAMYGDYMTTGVYEKLTTRYLMASLAAGENYSALYDGYAQPDLDAYYKENADDLDTVEYSFLYFAVPAVDTKDADGNELAEDEVQKLKDEARAGAREKAEAALKAVEGGAAFDAQAEKYELTTAASHGDHTKVVGTGGVNSTYSEELFKLKEDECKLVETENGYYVISFHSRWLETAQTRDVRHILVRAETAADENNEAAAPTDEAWAAAKARMDEIQAAWNSGDRSEDAFAALADEYSDDGDGTTGGLYERVPAGRFVPELDDWIFHSARRYGDVEMLQHVAGDSDGNKYYGYHLIFYVGENEPTWMGTARSSMAQEAQQEWIDDLSGALSASELDGARYFGK